MEGVVLVSEAVSISCQPPFEAAEIESFLDSPSKMLRDEETQDDDDDTDDDDDDDKVEEDETQAKGEIGESSTVI